MTDPRREARRVAGRWMGCFLSFASIGASSGAHAASASDLYFERTVARKADERCKLFDRDLAFALTSAQLQARGAALRSGVAESALLGLEVKASQRVGRVSCSSNDMHIARERIQGAFNGFARMSRIAYPGEIADWQADRTMTREPSWRLSQQSTIRFDRVAFGLVGREGVGVLVATAQFADGAVPSSARIVLRDIRRTGRPYLDHRRAATGGKLPLPARMPPASATRVFTAEFRTSADPRLLPGRKGQGHAFRFPDAAKDALAGLDPREAFMVEFVFPGRTRDEVRTAWMEVGDFAAAKAFLQVAYR